MIIVIVNIQAKYKVYVIYQIHTKDIFFFFKQQRDFFFSVFYILTSWEVLLIFDRLLLPDLANS